MKKFALAALAVFSFDSAAQQPGFQEGTHYAVLEQPAAARVADGVVVTEAFSYLCTHCATFEPYIQAWKGRLPEGVRLTRIPVEFGRQAWGLYARAHVAAAVMGIDQETIVPMMDAVWKQRRDMRTMEQLADFYAEFGVDKSQFLATAQSFAVDMRMRREQQLIREYQVSGTPTMIVNGKYRVSTGPAVPDFDVMLAVVDYLVARELAEQAAAQASADGS